MEGNLETLPIADSIAAVSSLVQRFSHAESLDLSRTSPS